MLHLVKFFDASENMAPRRFVLDNGVVEALRALGADLEKSSVAAPLSLKRGRDYSMESGAVSADLGTVITIMHLSQFFSREKGRNTFWSSLRSADAALFVASYGKRNSLSLLGEDTLVQRGSDIVKVEAAGTKLLVKRAMALETGKAKEIKAHLSRLIEVGDSRSVDERNSLQEMGSWGEAVYEFASKGTDAALALVSSKRFY